VDLVSTHAYERHGIDLLVGQAASSKRTSLVRCESLDLVSRLRLIGVDGSEPPEPPSACDGKWEAVIAETLGLQACSQLIHQAASLYEGVRRLRIVTYPRRPPRDGLRPRSVR
jgi:hypothetical protein